MSTNTITIKRYNHRMHPCTTEQKKDLLKYLVELYAHKSILIVSDANTTVTDLEDKNMTLCDDDGLQTMEKRQWDVVISFDLPAVADDYLARVSHAKEMALVIADEKEQEKLFLIETAIGKNLTRDIIEAFAKKEEVKSPTANNEKDDKRWDMPKKGPRKSYDKKPAYPNDTKKKFDSHYIGDDKDGKPQFTGKTNDRNHRYDGTPKTEQEKRDNPKNKRAKKSITVKSLKKSEDDA